MDQFEQRDQILLLGHRLQGFTQKRVDLWNSKCPICGDSKRNDSKARFYIFKPPGKSHYTTKCHNCGYSASFMTFFKNYFPSLYDQVIIEKFKPERKEKKLAAAHNLTSIKPVTLDSFSDAGYDYSSLIQITSLPKNHIAVQELKRRKIPKYWWDKHLMYCPDFHDFLVRIGEVERSEKYTETNNERIVIPFYEKDGQSFVFQGRDLSGNSKLRYITIKKNDEVSKIWGIDRIDINKPIFVLEGALDAMFLPQAVAMSGSLVRTPKEWNKIYILDNEPRNSEIVKIYRKLIKNGEKVVLWPAYIKQKDINDMILAGYGVNQLLHIIKESIVCGMIGELSLNKWQKCV